MGLSCPGAFFCPSAQCRGPNCALLSPISHPFSADSPALDWRSLPPGWTFGAGRRRQPMSPPPGRVGLVWGRAKGAELRGRASIPLPCWQEPVMSRPVSHGSRLGTLCSIPLLALPQDGEQHGQSHSPASYSRSSTCGTPSSPPRCGVSSSFPPARQPGGQDRGSWLSSPAPSPHSQGCFPCTISETPFPANL